METYYTKQTLQTKVKQLEEATGSKLELISCNGEYAIQFKDGLGFGSVGYYHSIKHLIIYADGFLAGMKYSKQ